MATTYDLSTNIGKLRLLLQDTDITDAFFEDEELEVFLDMHDDSLNMAAYTGWMTIAGDKAKLAKRKTSGKYSHDLTQMAKECREQALIFKAAEDGTPAADYAEWGVTDFARREIILNAALRRGY